MRTKVITRAVIVLVGICATVYAQDKAAIIKKLQAEYALTKTTADQTDIVTSGAVLVLQKDNLLMVATTTSGNPCPNTYKDGKFTQNGACRMSEKFKKVPLFGHTIPGADKAQVTSRTYVTGEKFWVTRIDIKDGKDAGVVMDFFTDAVSDVRYRTSLTIPFKGAMPSADDAFKLVQEVVTVAPSDDDKDKKEAKGNGGKGAPQGGQQAAAPEPAQQAAAAPVAEAAPAPIEPPPPPPDAPVAPPPTVAMDQTPDQVTAILGPPQKKAKIGTKEIYFYKDVKVTFVNGKVKDIQ